MYKSLIEALFTDKSFTVYGFDYTECKAHTTTTVYCWRDCKPVINILLKGIYAEDLPKGYKLISTSTTCLGEKIKFFEVKSHPNQTDLKTTGEWIPYVNKANTLLCKIRDAPFIKTLNKTAFCSCGKTLFVNKTIPKTIIYTCYSCKTRFFWHPNVLTICYQFNTHKKSSVTPMKDSIVKFTDPKGVELKMELGSCGHAWIPLREGKKCPTCFLTNTILKQLSDLNNSINKLKQDIIILDKKIEKHSCEDH